MPYLIQGYAFKKELGIVGVRFDPEEGKVPDIRMSVRGDMFYGVISTEEEKAKGDVADWMDDDFWGMSEISDVSLVHRKMSFIRRLEKTGEEIQFEFHWHVCNTWLGQYVGERVGTGACQLIMTYVDAEFFRPEKAMKEFRMTEPHIPTPESVS